MNAIVYVFAVRGHIHYEGRSTLSVHMDEAAAVADADAVAAEMHYDRVTVRRMQLGQPAAQVPHEWDDPDSIVYEPYIPSWEERRALERAAEWAEKIAIIQAQDPRPHDHCLRTHLRSVKLANYHKHADNDSRGERQMAIRGYNKAVRRQGRRICREWLA